MVTLSDAINTVVENRLIEMHTSMPGIVKSFDGDTGTIQVVPALKRKTVNNEVIELPVINDVPVVYPQTSKAAFTFPLSEGDEVLLIFSERSIDSWKELGGVVDPLDFRKFQLSDAFAIPFSRSKQVATDKMQIKYENGIISIDDDGKYSIGNSNQELLDLISQLLDALVSAKVNTQLGPQPLINAATFAQIKTDLGEIKQ